MRQAINAIGRKLDLDLGRKLAVPIAGEFTTCNSCSLQSAEAPIARLLWIVAALMLQLHGSSVLAAQRVALVIGNSEYAALEHVRTASKDAEAVADALTRLNFSVIADTDSDQRSMRVFIRQFTDAIEKTDIALIYFSGRAIQENGVNYLLPVDARISRPEDVPLEGVDLSALVRQMGRSHAKRIIVVDAASDGPGGDQKQRSLFQGSGLAAMEPAEETLIGFAAEPGSVCA